MQDRLDTSNWNLFPKPSCPHIPKHLLVVYVLRTDNRPLNYIYVNHIWSCISETRFLSYLSSVSPWHMLSIKTPKNYFSYYLPNSQILLVLLLKSIFYSSSILTTATWCFICAIGIDFGSLFLHIEIPKRFSFSLPSPPPDEMSW